MVFGRKIASSPARPRPPSVEEILEDLKAARPEDPVYAHNQELTRDLVDNISEEGESGESNPHVLYKKVIEYVAAADQLAILSQEVTSGVDSLVASHDSLKELEAEVKDQVKAIREANRAVGQPSIRRESAARDTAAD